MSVQSKRHPKVKRTIYKAKQKEVLSLLARIATGGIFNQDHGTAVSLTMRIFEAVKGNEKRPLTKEEASALLRKGFNR